MRYPILPEEERAALLRRAYLTWVSVIATEVIERYGDEGRQVIMNALYKQAIKDGPRMVERWKPEKDMIGIIRTWFTINQMWDDGGFEVDIKELSAKRAVLYIYRCPLAEQWEKMEAPAGMCELWNSYGDTILKGIHPDFAIKRITNLYKGDPCCHEIWEIEESC